VYPRAQFKPSSSLIFFFFFFFEVEM